MRQVQLQLTLSEPVFPPGGIKAVTSDSSSKRLHTRFSVKTSGHTHSDIQARALFQSELHHASLEAMKILHLCHPTEKAHEQSFTS